MIRDLKVPIIVASSHTPDQGGGFFWCIASPRGREDMAAEHENDKRSFDHAILVEFSIRMPYAEELEPGERPEVRMTDYIDTHLLDLIETGQLGKIISRHSPKGC